MGDLVLVPGLGGSPGGGKGYLLQCSGLKNSMDRGCWQGTVHGIAKSQTPLRRMQWHPTPVLLLGNPMTEEAGGLQSMGLRGVGHD